MARADRLDNKAFLMSTTKKGNEFEAIVHDVLREQIVTAGLFGMPELCKLRKKPKYYSRDRQGDIIFDLSIEVYFPGQKNFTFLVIVECKNYSHKVPVDDAEEFFQKVQQVSGANIKAIMVANGAFQEATVRFSKSKGMGLWRYTNTSEFDFILPRSPSSLLSPRYENEFFSPARNAINNPDYSSRIYDCHYFIDGLYTSSTALFIEKLITSNQAHAEVSLAKEMIIEQKKRNCQVHYLTKQYIESLCSQLHKSILYDRGWIDLRLVHYVLNKRNPIAIEEVDALPFNALGEISFNPMKIKILKDNGGVYRKRFTLAHELGHATLRHDKYLFAERCTADSIKLDRDFDIGIKEVLRLEWQANYFASCLLLPRQNLIDSFYVLIKALDIRNKGFGFLYLDDQPCNRSSYARVTSALMQHYQVSRSVIKYRLIDLGLLVDEQVTQTKESFPLKSILNPSFFSAKYHV